MVDQAQSNANNLVHNTTFSLTKPNKKVACQHDPSMPGPASQPLQWADYGCQRDAKLSPMPVSATNHHSFCSHKGAQADDLTEEKVT